MSQLTDDLDPRLLIAPVEASYQMRPNEDPVNGILILSRVGLHFYGQKFNASRKTFTDVPPEHMPLADIQVGSSTWTSTPIITATVYQPLGKLTRTYNVGYTKAIGRGSMGKLIAGVGNASKHLSTDESRGGFISSVAQMKKQAPSLSATSKLNPHIARLRYFADASALGPAIRFTDMVLRYAEKQELIARGPSFSERGPLKEEGYNKNEPPLPPLSPEDVISVKRQRAWLLFEGQRYRTLIEESQRQLDRDAEVSLVYAIAHIIMGNRTKGFSLIQKAQQLEPDKPEVHAATAWLLAMQGKEAEARAEMAQVQQHTTDNRQVLFLLGCASEFLGEHDVAIEQYFASVAQAKGYIEGANVTQRVISLAHVLDAQRGLNLTQRLTQAVPEQREAWKGLVLVAKRASHEEIAKQAQEHITAMQGVML